MYIPASLKELKKVKEVPGLTIGLVSGDQPYMAGILAPVEIPVLGSKDYQ